MDRYDDYGALKLKSTIGSDQAGNTEHCSTTSQSKQYKK